MLRFSLNIFNYQSVRLTRSRTKLVIVLLLGLSASVLLTGLLLRRRRRRYRAVSAGLKRSNTFESPDCRDSDSRESSFNHAPNYAPFYDQTSDGATAPGEESSIVAVRPSSSASCLDPSSCNTPVTDHCKLKMAAEKVEEMVSDTALSRRESASSDDSFFSANEEAIENQLYISARKLVQKKEVMCRKNRAALLSCESEDDFLAKLYCVRQAFDVLVQNPTHRLYFVDTTREIFAGILQTTNQDPSLFLHRFQDLLQFLKDDSGWEMTEKELMSRKVVCVNVYDVVLDFIMLDAFDELKDPPTTLLNVLRNRWLTENLKMSGISTVIWGVSMAKKGLLKNKMGFMHHFYSLSETISPTLAWGFMGTNTTLTEKCLRFKAAIQEFTRSIFSLEQVRYCNIDTLSDDILYHARQTAQSLQT